MDEEKQASSQQPERASWALHSWCRDLVLCITVVTLLFAFLVRLVNVDGSSMYPTLQGRGHCGHPGRWLS